MRLEDYSADPLTDEELHTYLSIILARWKQWTEEVERLGEDPNAEVIQAFEKTVGCMPCSKDSYMFRGFVAGLEKGFLMGEIVGSRPHAMRKYVAEIGAKTPKNNR